MKPIIAIVAAAGLFSFTACNTSELREKEVALQLQQQQINALNMELAKKKAIDSMNEVARMQYSTMGMGQMQQNPYMMAAPGMMMPGVQYAAAAAPQREVVRYVQRPARRTSTARRSYARSNTRSYAAAAQPVVYQEPVRQRRGWSAKAKGAVIGTVGGAAAGAIINKRNRPVGALIGGVLGAGAGTGIGAIIDRRNGR